MNYDPTFELAMIRVFRNEGGYVNDPSDSGGETKYGISKRVYPNLDIKNLTQDQARAIYYRDWWVHFHYDQITNGDLSMKMLDSAINLGAPKANKLLQRCLNVNGYPSMKDDGNFGPVTIKAINTCNAPTILSVFRQAQANYYRAVVKAHPEDSKFLDGWLNRASQ